MDRFGYSLLPAAAEAGLDTTTLSRQLPLLRRAVARHEVTLVVAHARGGLLVLLTDGHLVVTRTTRPLHRIRYRLYAGIDEIRRATWSADPARGAVELHVELHQDEHEFLVEPGFPRGVDGLAAAFRHAFDPAPGDPGPAAGGAEPAAPARRPGLAEPTLATFLSVQPSWNRAGHDGSGNRSQPHSRMPHFR